MSDREIIPLASYPGRKGAAGAWQKIVSEIPKCDRFVDCMCGSGYLSSLLKGCEIVLNDLNRSVIDKINCAAGVVKENEDYRKLVKKYSVAGSVFYFDPPYMFATRSYKRSIYKHEWLDSDHVEFLQFVQSIDQPVMISHYPCGLYDQALNGWRKITFNSMTRAGVRVEGLYMNYQQPVLLQCPQYIGENFTDRQRIQRKVKRLMDRLIKEDPQERAAILSSIIDRFDYMTGGVE